MTVSGGAAKTAAVAISAILTVLVVVPFLPAFPASDLDSSWAYAMNIAVARGLQFGRDVIFTYGPLASIVTRQYFPATDAIMVIGSTTVATAVFVLFWGVCDRKLLLWLLVLPVVLSQYYQLDPVFIMLPPMVLLFCVRSRFDGVARTAAVALSAAALGLLPLIKGSYTLAVAVCAIAMLALLWPRSRGLVFYAAVIFAATLICGWLLSRQELAGLPRYFIAQQPIVSGYSDAMSLEGPAQQITAYSVVAIALIAAIWRADAKAPWYVVVAVALVLFLIFKSAFVRHDPHAIAAGFALVFLGFFVVLWDPSRFAFGVFIAAVATWFFITANYLQTTPATMAARFADVISSSARGAYARVFDRAMLATELERSNARIRAKIPLSATGSTDLFPTDVAALFANHLDWVPRPVFQSYSAYTPRLEELNNQHLDTAGPDRLFVKIAPIDNRYPALEDGKSWITMIERYRAAGFSGGYAVLDRRPDAERIIETPIATISGGLGQEISLRGMGGPLFVRIEVDPTITGRLLNLAFKPNQLRIELTYANGDKANFRYVAGMGPTGFLLSPTVATEEQFVALESPSRGEYFHGKAPVSFRIYEAESEWPASWRPNFMVKLSRLIIPGDESVDSLLFAAPTKLASLDGFKPTPDCFIDLTNDVDPNGRPITTQADLLRLRGWAMVGAKDGIQNDSVSLALVNADGSALVFPMKKTNRADVGAYFKHSEAVMVGFEDALNVKHIDGSKEVRVLQTRGANKYICERGYQLQR